MRRQGPESIGKGGTRAAAARRGKGLVLCLFGAIGTLLTLPACGQQPPAQPALQLSNTGAADECLALRRGGKLEAARGCFGKLTTNRNPYLRAEGYWGLGMVQQANGAFQEAVKAAPKDAKLKSRWGRLYFERNQKEDAAELFEEALEIEKEYPAALLGLARIAGAGFDKKAFQLAEQAAKAAPKSAEPYEVLARLAAEDSDFAKAEEYAKQALTIAPDSLDALGLLATLAWLQDKPGTEQVQQLEKLNPYYGEAWMEAARLFVINRRYEEGIALYRKALEKNPELLAARSELGVNLMRLGEEEEARKELETCYEAQWRDAATTNTLKLMDSYKNFVTIKKGRVILRLHKKEIGTLQPYFERELERAVETFEKKYEMKLSRPVQLEVYPDHEDFAVRTMGLPGLGALGVTFGYVVAMDSPSGRKPGTFHWASTLWHELSHVYALSITKHKVPRWFTEGLAVHEETAVDPTWGDRLDPGAIRAVLDKKLLPVKELDRGFIRPSYPNQVIISYFQAGQICDYIYERKGWSTLLQMLRAFGAGKSTAEVITQYTGVEPEEFDKNFGEWLQKRYSKQLAGFTEWSKELKELGNYAKAKQWDEVATRGRKLIGIYPDFVEDGSPYEMLAEAFGEQKRSGEAREILEQYARIGGRDPEMLKKLAAYLEGEGKLEAAAQALERINAIYPVRDEAMHRKQGELWLQVNQPAKAVREFEVALGSQPVDMAGAYYNLARALRANGQVEQAKENLVLALEAAPSFRPAQRLLLELSK